ncbi:hypothetical protein BDK51DRAFT_44070 [Blyttiomyces helicus]|uniref:Uncharacterized protein n=1 Tax=Blyttiomyces helicus TaxID=388810 RepID=A0A4P9WP98_9FUNG|nr:hypothetical protein BDK51DRAFT_44070 [Blyttiomyces helicus]|eukprot:RKO93943.1 hypothetical protein BDK51DRAFT_44070 [Blyttiomyces helicus]
MRLTSPLVVHVQSLLMSSNFGKLGCNSESDSNSTSSQIGSKSRGESGKVSKELLEAVMRPHGTIQTISTESLELLSYRKAENNVAGSRRLVPGPVKYMDHVSLPPALEESTVYDFAERTLGDEVVRYCSGVLSRAFENLCKATIEASLDDMKIDNERVKSFLDAWSAGRFIDFVVLFVSAIPLVGVVRGGVPSEVPYLVFSLGIHECLENLHSALGVHRTEFRVHPKVVDFEMVVWSVFALEHSISTRPDTPYAYCSGAGLVVGSRGAYEEWRKKAGEDGGPPLHTAADVALIVEEARRGCGPSPTTGLRPTPRSHGKNTAPHSRATSFPPRTTSVPEIIALEKLITFTDPEIVLIAQVQLVLLTDDTRMFTTVAAIFQSIACLLTISKGDQKPAALLTVAARPAVKDRPRAPASTTSPTTTASTSRTHDGCFQYRRDNVDPTGLNCPNDLPTVDWPWLKVGPGAPVAVAAVLAPARAHCPPARVDGLHDDDADTSDTESVASSTEFHVGAIHQEPDIDHDIEFVIDVTIKNTPTTALLDTRSAATFIDRDFASKHNYTLRLHPLVRPSILWRIRVLQGLPLPCLPPQVQVQASHCQGLPGATGILMDHMLPVLEAHYTAAATPPISRGESYAAVTEAPDEIDIYAFESAANVRHFRQLGEVLVEWEEKDMSDEDMFAVLNKLTLELYSDVIVEELPDTIPALDPNTCTHSIRLKPDADIRKLRSLPIPVPA